MVAVWRGVPLRVRLWCEVPRMVISIAYPVADITIFFLVGLGYDTVVIVVGVGDRAAFGEHDK